MSEEIKESTNGGSEYILGCGTLYLNEKEREFNIPPKEMKVLSDYLKDLKDPNKSIRIALQDEREKSVRKAIAREEK